MQATKKTLFDFIPKDGTFVIPVYQRNYDWQPENCKQLFYDILNITKNPETTHFIGTICNKVNGKNSSIIIDGQQRITTIMLLLKALHDITDDNLLKEKIKEYFLINKYQNDELKIKLKPIKKDEYIYSKLINNNNFNINDFDKKEKESNIYKNYILFKDLINDALKEDYKANEIEDAIERLEIIDLELDNENPQIIFESLNSTGLDLTNTDLIRNYLLMSLSYKDQEELYSKYWIKIEENLGSENVEEFMIKYIVMKRRSHDITINNKKTKIGTINLYKAFKKEFKIKDKEKAEEFLKDLYKYSEYYKHFLFDEKSSPNGIDKKLYDIFYILEASDAAIIIMYLYDLYTNSKITKEIFEKMLDISITFILRTKICKRNGFNRQFTSLAIAKLENYNDYNNFDTKYWEVLTKGKGTYSLPKDNEFIETLISKDIYAPQKIKLCKYILYKINQYKTKEIVNYNIGTIEHIMPKTLSSEWKNYLNSKHDLMNYENYVNNIGNLTLTGYNSELSNHDFYTKRTKFYKFSNFIITREINDMDWTSKQINARAKKIAELAIKIWDIPQNHNKDIAIDTGITYNLDSDFAYFSGTKPFIISIEDNEKEILSWKDLLIYICEYLYDYDELLFKELLNYKFKDKPIISYDKTTYNSPKQIKNGPYIESNCSAEQILRNTAYLLEFFDKNKNTNLKDETWFTLRKA